MEVLGALAHVDSVEVKKKNILHHDVEADFFETIHREGSNLYERSKALDNISFIARNSTENNLCIDIGCGTGFFTGFELPRCETVVAIDISRRMLEVAKRRLKSFDGLNLLLCDAEHLPLRNEIADMVSASSVLHHLPKPFWAVIEISRTLKTDGVLYITREPNDVRFRRLFNFLDEVLIRKVVEFMSHLLFLFKRRKKSSIVEELVQKDGLNYQEVDVHAPTGFNVEELSSFLSLNSFEVISAHSYHWTFFDIISRINFLIEKIPFSDRFGRYICLISKKRSRALAHIVDLD